MYRAPRFFALSILAATVVVAACKKRQDTPPVTPVNNPASETCDSACRARRADSIARAREDSIRRANESANSANAAAVAAIKATLVAPVYFDYDSADLLPDARTGLDAKLPHLRAFPQVRIRVSGHADERGSDEYNLALGQRRAAAAKRYLVDQGIDGARIDIISFGEQQAAVPGSEESAYSRNRRDEFEIVGGADTIVRR
jgi:peptidoglycan-associated lipoprotein